MKKSKTFIPAAALLAACLTLSLQPLTVEAAGMTMTTPTHSIFINNVEVENTLIRDGQTFVTLTDLKILGNAQFQYNNAKKQITINRDHNTLILTAGSKMMLKNGIKMHTLSAPFIYKGKTMIPLRSVAEAFDADVVWNPYTKTAYIGKADAALMNDVNSSTLSTARHAAIKVPRYSTLKGSTEYIYLEKQDYVYYFPKNESNRFFEWDNNLISYYEIDGDQALLKWQAQIDPLKKVQHDNIFFMNYAFKKEIGIQPEVGSLTMAHFVFQVPVGQVIYHLIDKNGNVTKTESVNIDSNHKGIIFDIPEETKQ